MDNIIGHTNLIRVLNYLKKKYYNIPKDSNGEYTIGDAIRFYPVWGVMFFIERIFLCFDNLIRNL